MESVRCGGLGEEVHHKKRLTVLNVMDSEISLNQENLGVALWEMSQCRA